jgi:hypothetical protein
MIGRVNLHLGLEKMTLRSMKNFKELSLQELHSRSIRRRKKRFKSKMYKNQLKQLSRYQRFLASTNKCLTKSQSILNS